MENKLKKEIYQIQTMEYYYDEATDKLYSLISDVMKQYRDFEPPVGSWDDEKLFNYFIKHIYNGK